MKGRICYIVISVMLAVTIGFSFDISAYTPADSTGTAVSDKEETTVTQEKPVSNVPSLEKQDEVVKETAQAKGSSAERSVSAKTKAIASVRESSAAEESSHLPLHRTVKQQVNTGNGRAFVIAPRDPVNVKKFDDDLDKLGDLYFRGYNEGISIVPALKKYLA